MKKLYLLIAFFFSLLIAANILFFRSFYKMQINHNKNFLLKQSEVSVNEMERTLTKFESDLNYILFEDDIDGLFKDDNNFGLSKLQLFYSTYNGLIKNIDIYDNHKNVLNIFRNPKDNFITDIYTAQRQRVLVKRDDVVLDKDKYQYILPVFKGKEVYANILVTVNFNHYILSVLRKFHLDDISWQWIIDLEDGNVTNAEKIQYNWNGKLDEVLANLNEDLEGMLIHTISNDSLDYKILSVYTPAHLLNRNFGIALSIDYNTFMLSVFSRLAIVAGISLLIFLFVSILLLYQIKTLKKKIKV